MSRPGPSRGPAHRPGTPISPDPASYPASQPAFTVVRRRGQTWIPEAEVRGYVEQVRREFDDMQRRMTALQDETHRLKDALARWQSRQAATATEDGYVIPRPMRDSETRPGWDQPTGPQPAWPPETA